MNSRQHLSKRVMIEQLIDKTIFFMSDMTLVELERILLFAELEIQVRGEKLDEKR